MIFDSKMEMKVCEMQTRQHNICSHAETWKKGQPVERLYRMLFNRDLYMQAYAKLYPNKGAMTPGATPETVDGMSMDKIDSIIEAIKYERYQWTPVRRTYIKKGQRKAATTWITHMERQTVAGSNTLHSRSILRTAIQRDIPMDSDLKRVSHRSNEKYRTTWTGVKWIIEGDISPYFDTIDHSVLIEILREKINDNRFIRLIQGLLKAGYMEDWKYNKTYSGTPQGGVLSPLLANIYLDKLDQHVAEVNQAL